MSIVDFNLYISSSKLLRSADIELVKCNNDQINVKIERCFVFWPLHFYRNLLLQYSHLKASPTGRFFLFSREFLRFAISFPKQSISNFLYSYKLTVLSLADDSFPLTLNANEPFSIWISRQCTLNGIATKDDGVQREIELLRKGIKQRIFCWKVEHPTETLSSTLTDQILNKNSLHLSNEHFDVVRSEIVKPIVNVFNPGYQVDLIENCNVSNGYLVSKDNRIYEQDFFDSMMDIGIPSASYSKYEDAVYSYIPKKIQCEVRQAIFIGNSTNWCHFLLQKAVKLFGDFENDLNGIPILIREDSPKQIFEVARMLTKVEPIECKYNQRIKVEKLYCINERFFSDQYALVEKSIQIHKLSKELRKIYEPKRKIDSVSRIWLPRISSQYRDLSNRNEITNFLEHLNFKTFYPGKYNLRDQIQVFSECDVLISEAGSALTNLIFCDKSIRLIVLAKNDFDFELWRSLCRAMGIVNTYWVVGGKSIGKGDYKISLSTLKNLVNNL